MQAVASEQGSDFAGDPVRESDGAGNRLHIWQGLHEGKDAERWVESHLEASRAAIAELLDVSGDRGVENTLEPYDRAAWHLRMAGSQSHVMFMVHPLSAVRDAVQAL